MRPQTTSPSSRKRIPVPAGQGTNLPFNAQIARINHKTKRRPRTSQGHEHEVDVDVGNNGEISFQFMFSQHQKHRAAQIEALEAVARRDAQLRARHAAATRQRLAREAKKSSKINRRQETVYNSAMQGFATRRMHTDDAQPWDAMTKLREEAKLQRATQKAAKDRRSAPLKKVMDRAMRGRVEPAIPIAYFKADALYKELVAEEQERHAGYNKQFAEFQASIRKEPFDKVEASMQTLLERMDANPVWKVCCV